MHCGKRGIQVVLRKGSWLLNKTISPHSLYVNATTTTIIIISTCCIYRRHLLLSLYCTHEHKPYICTTRLRLHLLKTYTFFTYCSTQTDCIWLTRLFPYSLRMCLPSMSHTPFDAKYCINHSIQKYEHSKPSHFNWHTQYILQYMVWVLCMQKPLWFAVSFDIVMYFGCM